MRRIVKSLAAVLGVLSLGACGGGGSVLSTDNSNTPDRVIVTVQGGSNVARVLPGAGLPLSAVAVKGTQNGFLSNNRFKWSAALTTGGQYVANTLGVLKPCASIMFQPAGPPGVAAFPYTADFGIYIAIDPTNEANIEFIPPTIVPNPNPIPAPPAPVPPGAGTLSTNFPYCVTVTATPIGGSALNSGSITVAVVNPQNPLQ
ncbi:MAG: hypothetical protein JWM87_3607 [Candidatus Eremiobacteraeota bacterium]|nr:hypothetical protein [Candidatus Eremiobacteraeota bacterium]